MVEIKLVSVLLWGGTASLLLLFIIISSFIYRTNHDNTFKYYALYCFFVLLYVIYKFDFYLPFTEWIGGLKHSTFNWMVQVAYHAFYMKFGIRFLEFHTYYPTYFKAINRYSNALLILSALGILLGFVSTTLYPITTLFFLYVFLPVHLSVAIFIVAKAMKTKAFARHYFTTGSFVYMLFAMYALFISYNLSNNPLPGLMGSIDFFYFAVILECLIFSYGLSYKIRQMHNSQLVFQKELEIAQQKIQQQLKEELNFQQKENQILAEQKQKQELMTKIVSLQQTVLRSQMNSHFVFNVLNSIKLFIMENDSKKATLYLGKFARFIRSVLDGSLHELVSLADELNTIELYIHIEQMRFNDAFEYRIETQEGINLNQYLFPPLLLQPFVENALWHGLMQIRKDARLIIKVSSAKGNLCIEIDDNGPGYKKNIMKKKNGHTSLGLKIVQERIEHYNQTQNFNLNYTLIDKSEISEESGTLVRIVLNQPI